MNAILFDAVGTLITPHPHVAEAYQAAGAQFGSQLTVESIRLWFRTAFARQEKLDANGLTPHHTSEVREVARWRAIVSEVFNDVPDPEGLFAALWDHFAQPQHWHIYEDVADCCARLRADGHRLGIASNFDARLDALCAGLPVLAGLAPRFVSSRIGYKKPSLAFFRSVERVLELSPHQIVLVGDDLENDFLAARRAGWQAVLLDRGASPASALTATPICHTLSELPEMLAGGCIAR